MHGRVARELHGPIWDFRFRCRLQTVPGLAILEPAADAPAPPARRFPALSKRQSGARRRRWLDAPPDSGATCPRRLAREPAPAVRTARPRDLVQQHLVTPPAPRASARRIRGKPSASWPARPRGTEPALRG